jgi:4-amino-4-deoxy-L-arabinose transferase-like glycosyltransferase
MAARQGFVANALDVGGIYADTRHHHAPLSIYAIAVSGACLGWAESAVRLPGVIAAALACALAVLAGYDLAPRLPRRRGWARPVITTPFLRALVGLASGLLLATAPASISMVQIMKPHPFVVAVLVLNLWAVGRYVRRPSLPASVFLGISLGLQFAAMEYGPIVVTLAVAAIALTHPDKLAWRRTRPWIVTQPHLPWLALHREIQWAIVAALVTLATIWPAGVFKGHAVIGFLQLAHYAAGGHPIIFRGQRMLHVPKYAYLWWYGEQYPLLLGAMLLATALIVWFAWRRRHALAIMFGVFLVGLTASVHAAHIMELCYSLFMIPALALGAPWVAAALVRAYFLARQRWSDPWLAARPLALPIPRLRAIRALAPPVLACVTVAAMVAGGRLQPLPPGDQANQRIVDASLELSRRAGRADCVLAQAAPVVRYTLMRAGREDVVVTPLAPWRPEDQLCARLAQHEFAWAITTAATTGAYPHSPALEELHRAWRVVAEFAPPPREDRLYQAPPPSPLLPVAQAGRQGE